MMDLPEQEAANVLYRREIDKVGEGKTYTRPNEVKQDTVLVERLTNFAGLDVVCQIARITQAVTVRRAAMVGCPHRALHDESSVN